MQRSPALPGQLGASASRSKQQGGSSGPARVSPTAQSIKGHTRVVLTLPVVSRTVAHLAGTCGAVVGVYDGGVAYSVEAFEPQQDVISVEADGVRPHRAEDDTW